jgi:hypothetical protein
MFTYASPTYTTYSGTSYNYTQVPQFMKSIGAKKVALVAFASPSAVLNAKQVAAEDPQVGLQIRVGLRPDTGQRLLHLRHESRLQRMSKPR